ncbi:hypothetical protein HYZ64_00985 [Candidatus Berkelbacteria bacterium]|nr:hypothetical protein [Candidatus Berkelbacteria bacterium]
MPSAAPQPGGEGATQEELAAKVAASFEVAKPPQVTQPEAMTPQGDQKAEAAATGEQVQTVKDAITNLPDQVAQTVSAPIRQVKAQVFPHPERAEESLGILEKSAKGRPKDLQEGVIALREEHIAAHNDLEHQEQAA